MSLPAFRIELLTDTFVSLLYTISPWRQIENLVETILSLLKHPRKSSGLSPEALERKGGSEKTCPKSHFTAEAE